MNEINSLKKQNEEMVLHIASLEQKLVSYISFEEHFNFNKENIKLFIPAQVVSKPNQSAYDTIIVSKGASDNISIDAPVYTSENSVIGFVDSF
jgi:cell shape-determining protein MreC